MKSFCYRKIQIGRNDAQNINVSKSNSASSKSLICLPGMFWWNLIVDASFIVDMGIQPFQGWGSKYWQRCDVLLALLSCHGVTFTQDVVRCIADFNYMCPCRYWDEDHDLWVMDLREIRRRYLRSWFMADFIAATPYDVLAVIFHDHWLGKLQVRPKIPLTSIVATVVVYFKSMSAHHKNN